MSDYGYTFSRNLHALLKSKVYAGVCVKELSDDRLEIIIARSDEGLVFTSYIDNFSQRIFNGLSSEYLAYEVIEKYKKFIHNRFFIREEKVEIR